MEILFVLYFITLLPPPPILSRLFLIYMFLVFIPYPPPNQEKRKMAEQSRAQEIANVQEAAAQFMHDTNLHGGKGDASSEVSDEDDSLLLGVAAQPLPSVPEQSPPIAYVADESTNVDSNVADADSADKEAATGEKGEIGTGIVLDSIESELASMHGEGVETVNNSLKDDSPPRTGEVEPPDKSGGTEEGEVEFSLERVFGVGATQLAITLEEGKGKRFRDEVFPAKGEPTNKNQGLPEDAESSNLEPKKLKLREGTGSQEEEISVSAPKVHYMKDTSYTTTYNKVVLQITMSVLKLLN